LKFGESKIESAVQCSDKEQTRRDRDRRNCATIRKTAMRAYVRRETELRRESTGARANFLPVLRLMDYSD